jgi:hypothetical protein
MAGALADAIPFQGGAPSGPQDRGLKAAAWVGFMPRPSGRGVRTQYWSTTVELR